MVWVFQADVFSGNIQTQHTRPAARAAWGLAGEHSGVFSTYFPQAEVVTKTELLECEYWIYICQVWRTHGSEYMIALVRVWMGKMVHHKDFKQDTMSMLCLLLVLPLRKSNTTIKSLYLIFVILSLLFCWSFPDRSDLPPWDSSSVRIQSEKAFYSTMKLDSFSQTSFNVCEYKATSPSEKPSDHIALSTRRMLWCWSSNPNKCMWQICDVNSTCRPHCR